MSNAQEIPIIAAKLQKTSNYKNEAELCLERLPIEVLAVISELDPIVYKQSVCLSKKTARSRFSDNLEKHGKWIKWYGLYTCGFSNLQKRVNSNSAKRLVSNFSHFLLSFLSLMLFTYII
jgi:hypothetical protein